MSAHRIIWPVLAALVTVGLSPVPVHQAGQPPAPGLILVWSDEFDGEEIEKTKWDFDIGNGFLNEETNTWINGWGNGELQYYTQEPENAFVKDGMLHIRVLKQTRHGYGYTSARVKTRKRDRSPLFNKKYGLFEFRAKLPTGKGQRPLVGTLDATPR
jgi:beta-glucanase (GH16 family)